MKLIFVELEQISEENLNYKYIDKVAITQSTMSWAFNMNKSMLNHRILNFASFTLDCDGYICTSKKS